MRGRGSGSGSGRGRRAAWRQRPRRTTSKRTVCLRANHAVAVTGHNKCDAADHYAGTQYPAWQIATVIRLGLLRARRLAWSKCPLVDVGRCKRRARRQHRSCQRQNSQISKHSPPPQNLMACGLRTAIGFSPHGTPMLCAQSEARVHFTTLFSPEYLPRLILKSYPVLPKLLYNGGCEPPGPGMKEVWMGGTPLAILKDNYVAGDGTVG